MWAAPICCALLALTANYQITRAGSRGRTILLGVLALLVGLGALAKMALDISR